MSAHGMFPKFTDYESYQRWRTTWRALQRRTTSDIRKARARLRSLQEAAPLAEETRKLQSDLHYRRIMARKLMTLLDDAKGRWARIVGMREQVRAQHATFPLLIEAPRIDFHFNKGSLEFADLPMWVVKAKGQSFYVHHVDAQAPWTTREVPDGGTKGMLRFRHCVLELKADGTAVIRQAEEAKMAA